MRTRVNGTTLVKAREGGFASLSTRLWNYDYGYTISNNSTVGGLPSTKGYRRLRKCFLLCLMRTLIPSFFAFLEIRNCCLLFELWLCWFVCIYRSDCCSLADLDRLQGSCSCSFGKRADLEPRTRDEHVFRRCSFIDKAGCESWV